MDPITALINAVNSVAGLVTALAQLETVNREKESPAHRDKREELEIEAYKIGIAFLRALPRPDVKP